MRSAKISYPSAARNCDPILKVLLEVIGQNPPAEPQRLLEIASGTGQHSAHFAPHFPNVIFQPSEYEPSLLPSIAAYAADCPTSNIRQPISIDVQKNFHQWDLTKADQSLANGKIDGAFNYILNVNMIHISPYSCTIGLFANASSLLKPNGLLITYGPYAIDGVITPQSNIDFDRSLRQQNSDWGLRDIADLKVLGQQNGFKFEKYFDMPANNKICLWRKYNNL